MLCEICAIGEVFSNNICMDCYEGFKGICIMCDNKLKGEYDIGACEECRYETAKQLSPTRQTDMAEKAEKKEE